MIKDQVAHIQNQHLANPRINAQLALIAIDLPLDQQINAPVVPIATDQPINDAQLAPMAIDLPLDQPINVPRIPMTRDQPTSNDVNNKGKQNPPQKAKTKRKKMKVKMRELTALFNNRLRNGDLSQDEWMKLLYSSKTKSFRKKTKDPDLGELQRPVLAQDVQNLDRSLVKHAQMNPNRWIGPSLGDPGDPGNGDAPTILVTNIKTIYQQHLNPFCLTFSLASALFYCGFKSAASDLAGQAPLFKEMHFDLR